MSNSFANITAALAEASRSTTKPAPNRWLLGFLGGTCEALAVPEEGWLLLRAAPAEGTISTPPSLGDGSRWLVDLPVGTKVAFDGFGRLGVRGECPLDDADPRVGCVPAMVRGMESALALSRSEPIDAAVTSHASPPRAACTGAELESACAEAGWPAQTRSDGALRVELEPADLGHAAVLTPGEGGGFRAVVELQERSAFDSDMSRRALGRCLLRLNGAVRGARARLAGDEVSGMVVLEAFGHGAGCPSPIEVAASMASLSVAVRLCASEIAALATPEISERYLALAGEAALHVPTPNPELCKS